MELTVIDDKVYFLVKAYGYGYNPENIVVTNVNKVPLGKSQTVSFENNVYTVYIEVTDYQIQEDAYIFVEDEPFDGKEGKISLGRSDKTARPIDALYHNGKKYFIQMQYNTPKILIESVSASTSFITTDTARFEEVEGKLYYVASGTAYNVALDKFGFDLKPSNNSFNALAGQSITAKLIKDYGYNFKYLFRNKKA